MNGIKLVAILTYPTLHDEFQYLCTARNETQTLRFVTLIKDYLGGEITDTQLNETKIRQREQKINNEKMERKVSFNVPVEDWTDFKLRCLQDKRIKPSTRMNQLMRFYVNKQKKGSIT